MNTRKIFSGLTALLLSIGLVLAGCEGPTGADGAPGGGGGTPGDTILSGTVTEAAVRFALASGKPVVFAGATVTPNPNAPIVIDRAVTLVANSPALSVGTGTVVVTGDFLTGTGTIAAAALISPAPAALARAEPGTIAVASAAPASDGTVEWTDNYAAIPGTTQVLHGQLGNTKTLVVFGNLTVSATTALAAKALNATGDVTVTDDVTGTSTGLTIGSGSAPTYAGGISSGGNITVDGIITLHAGFAQSSMWAAFNIPAGKSITVAGQLLQATSYGIGASGAARELNLGTNTKVVYTGTGTTLSLIESPGEGGADDTVTVAGNGLSLSKNFTVAGGVTLDLGNDGTAKQVKFYAPGVTLTVAAGATLKVPKAVSAAGVSMWNQFLRHDSAATGAKVDIYGTVVQTDLAYGGINLADPNTAKSDFHFSANAANHIVYDVPTFNRDSQHRHQNRLRRGKHRHGCGLLGH